MSRRTITIEGSLQANINATDEAAEELAEFLQAKLAVLGVEISPSAEFNNKELIIDFSYEGDRPRRISANNFAFAEKVAYVAQEAKEKQNIYS